jgi:hypothetical protein
MERPKPGRTRRRRKGALNPGTDRPATYVGGLYSSDVAAEARHGPPTHMGPPAPAHLPGEKI